MQIAPSIFKAYDIRGIYPTELNEEGAYAIGRAFVTFLGAREVIVGHDMRLSGPAIFSAVTRGIMDQGADVVNIGLVSTDQYYFACTRLGLPGMMVTASHNPKQYNGFKMVRQMPYLLSGAEGIQDLRRIVENDAYAPATRTGSMRTLDLSDEFVEFVLGLIDIKPLQRRRLKIIADTGNGTVGPILQRIYERLPINFIGMYLEPDATCQTTDSTRSCRRTAPNSSGASLRKEQMRGLPSMAMATAFSSSTTVDALYQAISSRRSSGATCFSAPPAARLFTMCAHRGQYAI